MKRILYLGIASLFILVGCKSKKNVELVGNDRDSHGCIGSAGYRWSEVKKDCIRVFESGMALYNAKDPKSNTVVYIVFSPDSTMVEAFMPGEADTKLLRMQGKMGYWSENPKFMGALNLYDREGVWELEEAGELLYSSKRKN